MDLASLFNLLLLIFGFGFVIFIHELGHFLAAKWAGVRVEQFAIGFGQALLSWRKGLGVRVGSSRAEFERRAGEHPLSNPAASPEQRLYAAADALGLGETEYRLNWIPLGGYVKMLGQDDLNPNATSPDPRAYNNKSIGQRMVIVSAGVIMNVILAGLLFCVLFLYGFRAPAPVAGSIVPGSPAQQAGLRVGDRVLSFDGATMHDYTKLRLAAVLTHPDEPAEMRVQRADTGAVETLKIQARRNDGDPTGFLQIGVGPASTLSAPRQLGPDPDPALDRPYVLRPGETVIGVNGVSLPPGDDPDLLSRNLRTLDEQTQRAGGTPVELTLRAPDGSTRTTVVNPILLPPFGREGLHFAGLFPRATIASVEPWSTAVGKLRPGDVVLRIHTQNPGNDALDHPSADELRERLARAGAGGFKVNLRVLRDGQPIDVTDLDPSVRLRGQSGRRGLGVGVGMETGAAVVAAVLPSGATAESGVRRGVSIAAVNGKPVGHWYDVHAALAAAEPGTPVTLDLTGEAGPGTTTLTLTPEQSERLRGYRYALPIELAERTERRRTANPLTAVAWGVGETRDLIVQFYVTLKRMLVQRSVGVQNLSGPVGILHSGTIIASRGPDWLIWYLAVISANLAVVNFLPLPIVDGGLFVFLIIEKLRGKPVSPAVQTATQLVGLALIVSLFLFVTYQDFLRML